MGVQTHCNGSLTALVVVLGEGVRDPFSSGTARAGTHSLGGSVSKFESAGGFVGAITAIIPAYNKSESIADTIRSLQRQTYPIAEIIVVDDCSSDNTGSVAATLGVTVLRPPSNTGSKAGAQTYALSSVQTEFCMAIDADTEVAPDGVEKLVKAFSDPAIAAACGFVLPRHVSSVWERGRYIEYLFAFTFFKPIQDFLERPLISSGCFSAYRTDVLRSCGGWSNRTMAEDMDLTWTLYAAGHGVRFMPEALCYPIEPHDLHFLSKQLKRWSHGFIQNVRTHWRPVLADIQWEGRPRKVMLFANKNGLVYVLDRATGQFLTGTPFVNVDWMSGFDSKGRPIRINTESARVSPASATNWFPASYSPRTGLLYIPAMNRSRERSGFTVRGPWHGAITPFNPQTGKKDWEFRLNNAWFTGGVLTTGSDLLFTGTSSDFDSDAADARRLDGLFFVLDARTGAVLWKFGLPGPIQSPAITYQVRGKQDSRRIDQRHPLCLCAQVMSRQNGNLGVLPGFPLAAVQDQPTISCHPVDRCRPCRHLRICRSGAYRIAKSPRRSDGQSWRFAGSAILTVPFLRKFWPL